MLPNKYSKKATHTLKVSFQTQKDYALNLYSDWTVTAITPKRLTLAQLTKVHMCKFGFVVMPGFSFIHKSDYNLAWACILEHKNIFLKSSKSLF